MKNIITSEQKEQILEELKRYNKINQYIVEQDYDFMKQGYQKAAASTTDTQYTNREIPLDRFSEPVNDKDKAYIRNDEFSNKTAQDAVSQYTLFGKNAYYWQYMLKLLGKNLGNYGPKGDGVDGDFGTTSKRVLKSVVGNERMDLTNFKSLFSTISKNKTNLSKLLAYGNSLKKNVNNLKNNKIPLGGEEAGQITVISQGRKFNVNVKNVIKNAPRINQELAFINARREYIGVPFFIADPKNNLVLAFDEEHNLIDYSQSIAGASKNSEKVFTYKEWCELSKGIMVGGVCKDAEEYKKAKTQAEKDKVKGATMQYTILKNKGFAYAPKSILQVGGQSNEPGYSGIEGVNNVISLKTQDGVNIPAAIHGLASSKSRQIVDGQMMKFLKKEKSFGNIPKEYYDIVDELTKVSDAAGGLAGADQSAGCFNVDPKFIQNPRVLRISEPGTPVFVMGDSTSDYLVQVKPDETYDFFKTMASGKDGSCVSPNYLIQNYTTNVVDRKFSVV